MGVHSTVVSTGRLLQLPESELNCEKITYHRIRWLAFWHIVYARGHRQTGANYFVLMQRSTFVLINTSHRPGGNGLLVHVVVQVVEVAVELLVEFETPRKDRLFGRERKCKWKKICADRQAVVRPVKEMINRPVKPRMGDRMFMRTA